MQITGAKVFGMSKFLAHDLCTDGAQIAAKSVDGTVLDASGCYAIPGLTDLHFHGCKDADFSDGTAEGLQRIAAYQLSRGVTQICPAGMTLSREQLLKICKNAAVHCAGNTGGADLCGVNLEGPFLSLAKKGAQNGTWLQSPNADLLDELKAASNGLVKLVSIAPELPDAMDFIRAVKDRVIVSIAHTTADYDTAMEAFAAGVRQVTHLYNAMPPFSHRAPGVVGAAADTENCMVELICDGVHVHPSVVRATFRLFGTRRIILISDSMRACGMPDGAYTLGGQAVAVTGNRAVLQDGTLAGSVTDLLGCLQTAVGMGIPLVDAVTAAAVNPAKVLGIDSEVGSLEVGKQANIVLLDGDLNLTKVLFHGNVVYSVD